VDPVGPELRAHPALRQLVSAVQSWRAAPDHVSRQEQLRRYNEAASTLIGLGVTLYDLDPMDMLPDDLMPLVWQETYAVAFADAVALARGATAAD
jgi:hypothetical protein